MENVSPSRFMNTGDIECWSKSILAGIIRTYDVTVAGIGFLENRIIHIHLVDTFPSPGQTWEDHVTDRFEADICKGVVNSNGDVTFAMRKEDLERGCYKFIIRNLVHVRHTT